MKKLALLLLLVAAPMAAYAVNVNPVATTSTGTQTSVNYEGQTNFGYVGAWGDTTPGNPGYLVLKGCDSADRCFPYYFWVGSDAKLYQSSYITISAFASFPTGNWNRTNMPVGGGVGAQ